MEITEYLKEQKPLLIKVTKRKYAESFRKGKIYMNSLSVFREIENKGDEMTRDIYEGADHVIQSTEFDYLVSPTDKNFRIPSSTIIGGLWRGFEKYSCLKVFCFYDIKLDIQNKLIHPIDKRIFDFGDTYVLILDIFEFMNRINKELIKNDDLIEKPSVFRHVEYIDAYNYNGSVGPFRKCDEFRWQNEFRLCINLKNKNIEPYTLDIGDISDITLIGGIKEMVEKIRFVDENKLYFACD
ncbi:MAG: hypothetical protein FH753_02510 [Firmicutes bacterium]|nr:hypothetical protein [Bacillota bacterium]